MISVIPQASAPKLVEELLPGGEAKGQKAFQEDGLVGNFLQVVFSFKREVAIYIHIFLNKGYFNMVFGFGFSVFFCWAYVKLLVLANLSGCSLHPSGLSQEPSLNSSSSWPTTPSFVRTSGTTSASRARREMLYRRMELNYYS